MSKILPRNDPWWPLIATPSVHAIDNMPVGPWTVGTGEIVCDESLHGLLKSFRRAA